MGIRKYMEEVVIEKKEKKDNLDIILEDMSGADIAAELKISRQAVSYTLKRAMEKVFVQFQKENKTDAFETAVTIAMGFDIPDDEYSKFFKLFPPNIRKQIETDASKRMSHLKKK